MWSYKPDKQVLRQCLQSIDKAIPEENVCHRTAVVPFKAMWQDFDLDRYLPLGDHNWRIKYSDRPSLPLQANIALNSVDTDFFASFEQDVIVAPDWFRRMRKIIESDEKIAVTQGLRPFKGSRILEAVDKSKMMRKKDPRWFYSLDNNLYRTETIRKIGGFPTECPIGTDGLLRDRIVSNGYKWVTDHGCVSQHIHKSFKEYLKTYIRRTAFQRVFWERVIGTDAARTFLKSPFEGLLVFNNTHVPESVLGPFILQYCKGLSMLVAKATGRKTIHGVLPLDLTDV